MFGWLVSPCRLAPWPRKVAQGDIVVRGSCEAQLPVPGGEGGVLVTMWLTATEWDLWRQWRPSLRARLPSIWAMMRPPVYSRLSLKPADGPRRALTTCRNPSTKPKFPPPVRPRRTLAGQLACLPAALSPTLSSTRSSGQVTHGHTRSWPTPGPPSRAPGQRLRASALRHRRLVPRS